MNKAGLMIDIMKMELKKFANVKTKFVEEFSIHDYNYIEQVKRLFFMIETKFPRDYFKGWKDKVVRVNQGDQSWGLFTAQKDYSS